MIQPDRSIERLTQIICNNLTKIVNMQGALQKSISNFEGEHLIFSFNKNDQIYNILISAILIITTFFH